MQHNYTSDNFQLINLVEAWTLRRKHLKQKFKEDYEGLRKAWDELGPQPPAPMPPMLLLQDATMQGLQLFLEKRPSVGVFSAEAGTFIGGPAFKDENILHTASSLNILWDGAPLHRMRAGTGLNILPGRRVALHLMMHPFTIGKLLGNQTLLRTGTFSRILIAAPQSLIGHRRDAALARAQQDILFDHHDKLRELLRRKPDMDPAFLELQPRLIGFTPEARDLFMQVTEANEWALREDGPLGDLRDFGAKLPEHACRLAAMLAVYRNPSEPEVDHTCFDAGLSLALYYAKEQQRLRGDATFDEHDEDLRLAAKLLQWCRAKHAEEGGRNFSLQRMYQEGPPAIRTAKLARRMTAILAEHGELQVLDAGTTIDGRSYNEAYQLIVTLDADQRN